VFFDDSLLLVMQVQHLGSSVGGETQIFQILITRALVAKRRIFAPLGCVP
jgi:hypothetical protein